MRYLVSAAFFCVLGRLPLNATAPVPRVSPELKLLDSAGNQILLSSFTGKVVVIEFLLVNCPHCARVAQMINRLDRDLGPQGFQPLGVAFENGISGPLVMSFAQDFKITYPMGYTSSDKVDTFLGRVGMERFQVPQIVVIDHKGVIRAQSQPVGEKDLENETYLHSLLVTLLKEGSPSRVSNVSSISSAAILLLVGSVVIWKMKQRRLRVFAVAAILTCLSALVSFSQDDAKKAYTFHGKVEKVDRKTGKLTVSGEEVEGWMAAMTMAYRVDNPEVLKNIKAGNRITATVYERDLTLHDVRVVPPALQQK